MEPFQSLVFRPLHSVEMDPRFLLFSINTPPFSILFELPLSAPFSTILAEGTFF